MKKMVCWEYLQYSTSDATHVNYYEDNHSYDFHWDRSTVSACYTFFKEPKQFKGGRFNLENQLNFEPENNSMLIFPSFLDHKIENVTADILGRGLGRFSIVQFVLMA